MLIAMFRLGLVMLLIELIFYLLISIYLRSTKREQLEEEWDRRHPDRSGDSRERREFVRRSMRGFSKTLRARLVWLVFILPLIAVMTIIFYVNYH